MIIQTELINLFFFPLRRFSVTKVEKDILQIVPKTHFETILKLVKKYFTKRIN